MRDHTHSIVKIDENLHLVEGNQICELCGGKPKSSNMTMFSSEKVTKSKNQIKRENHIRKRVKARATAHTRIVTATLEGENIAPNHMVTSSVAKIKQTERSRFRMVNHNRIMSKGKACKCDGMNYMCNRHLREYIA